MDRMLYVAMSGAKETTLSQATNANNLANTNTDGFQADLDQFRSMPVFGNGFPTRVYALSERPQTNFARGGFNHTGRDLDVAVNGDGWIAVQAPDGNEAYTRRGDLVVDVNGLLKTANGLPVMGNSGPIAVPEYEKLEVGSDGALSIKPIGGAPTEVVVVDRIKLVNPPTERLEKGLDGLIHLKDGGEAEADANQRLAAGTLERSNVNAVDAMVNMIELSRRFEMQIKMMQTAEKIDESALSVMKG